MRTNLKLFFITILVLILNSCTSESDNNLSNPNNLPNITTIHAPTVNSTIYSTSINSARKEFINTNLSDELNIPNNWNFWTVIGDKISFIKRFQSPSIWQKNTATGETIIKENYYQLKENSQLAISTNSNNKLLNFYLEGPYQNGFEAYLDITDINNNTIKNVYIDKLEFISVSIAGDKAILKIENSEREMVSLALLDLLSGSIIEKIVLERRTFRFGVANENELYVFLSDNTFNVYSMTNLELLRSEDYNTTFYSAQVIADYKISDNKMAYVFPHVQPSPLGLGPAIYNFETKESKNVQLFNVLNFLVEELSTNIFISNFEVDLDREIIVVGFGRGFDLEGGIAFLDFEGEVIDYILLDYYPSDIIIQE